MNRTFKNNAGTMIPGCRIVHCKVATTTSGTLAATQTQFGLKLTKTATKVGRYTCQLVDALGNSQNAVGFVQAIVTLVGPDDAALTSSKGQWLGTIRDDDIGVGANDGTVEIQFIDPNGATVTVPDTEVQDGAIINVTLILRDSMTL